MVDIDKDNWGIDLSAILIYLGSLLRYLFTNLDSWVHSITGLIALAFISFRFYVAIKKYYFDRALSNPNSKSNLKKLVNSIVLDNDDDENTSVNVSKQESTNKTESVNKSKSNTNVTSTLDVDVTVVKKRKELKSAKKEK